MAVLKARLLADALLDEADVRSATLSRVVAGMREQWSTLRSRMENR
jgi:hypothetical protein